MTDHHDDAEERRLGSLDRYRVMDTATEPVFDQLVREAALLTGSPMSTLTLVANDRQWFKAKTGIARDGDPLDRSICAIAIRQPTPLIVPDASQDERFAAFPSVASEDGIRFYAGIPLTVRDGSRLGTLCVLDIEARETLSPEEAAALDALARRAVAALELRRDLIEEHEADEALDDRHWLESAARLLDRAAAALTQVGASAPLAQLETVIASVAALKAEEGSR